MMFLVPSFFIFSFLKNLYYWSIILYNVALASASQKSELALCIHIFPALPLSILPTPLGS